MIPLELGQEIVIVSVGSRKTGFRMRKFVVRGVGGGIQIVRVGKLGKASYSGIKKLFAGTIRGVVIGSSVVVGYEEDIVQSETIPRMDI